LKGDVLYLHLWDGTIEEVLRGIDDLVRQGKVESETIERRN
jgi:aryl-alcohol dehydrogenase-like predicted oxidoreductase